MTTFLVQADGSAAAANARRWATSIADATGARVVQPARRRARRPGLRLVEAADREGADLLVVGNGTAPASGLGAGSVAEYVAHHARRPFAVVPATSTVAVPHRVAVGLNGSAGAEEAAAWTAAFASAVQADVIAVDVLNPPPFLSDALPQLHESAMERLDGPWTKPFADAGLTVTTVVVDDAEPGEAFLAAAMAAHAETLVLGARVLVGVRLLHHHGATLHALHHSAVPVIVVPTDHGLPEPFLTPEREGEFTLRPTKPPD